MSVELRNYVIQRDGKDVVLYAGLLALAHERGLKAITTTLVQIPNEMNGQVAICHATVETEQGTFTGIGDAAPLNLNRMMAPHSIRMAETRAKARALRDAVNIGMTAAEELADDEPPAKPAPRKQPDPAQELRDAGAVVRESPPRRPGPDGTPRQWHAYLSAMARAAGLAHIPTISDKDTDEQITDLNRGLKAALQGAK